MADTLEYFNPTTHVPELRGSLRRVAILCGAGPLATGVLTFILWVVTRATQLMFIGAWIIIIGVILFAIGSLCLVAHVVVNWQYLKRAHGRGDEWRSIILTELLLASNFPACWVVVQIALALGAGRFLED